MKVDNTKDVEFENLKDSKPALSPEQYQQMAMAYTKLRELKQIGFDLRENLDSLTKHLEVVTKDIAAVEEALASTRQELEDKNKELQTCFDEYIMQPYGLTGEIEIAETEPHYITVKETVKS
jgi:chromosome segregation ATPase